MLAAYTYPLLDLFWTILWIALWVFWIWLLIYVFVDIFRSHDLSGWAKALWAFFVLILPFLGVFIYFIARGDSMQKRSFDEAQSHRQDFDQYVRQAAGPVSTADELAKLAQLHASGALNDADYEKAKAKVLG
jgi:hypothetical protein